jgi:hypothetical protein
MKKQVNYPAMFKNLKSFCLDTRKDINKIYFGGFSSREQSNFDGQLEIIETVLKMIDRRKNHKSD